MSFVQWFFSSPDGSFDLSARGFISTYTDWIFSPFGVICVILIAGYIFLRVSGRFGGIMHLFNRGGGNQGSGGNVNISQQRYKL